MEAIMKEIKFRVYDKRNWTNKMKYSKMEVYDDMVAFRFGHFDGELEDLILMQYTGLKDKNGKEIYEGDIVLYNYTMIGVVYYDEAKTSYILKPLNKTSSYEVLGLSTPLEVIGNIYEDPDLLEDS